MLVEAIREAAFGPLRSNPEIEALQADMDVLLNDIAEVIAAHVQLDKQLQDLKRRATETDARVKRFL